MTRVSSALDFVFERLGLGISLETKGLEVQSLVLDLGLQVQSLARPGPRISIGTLTFVDTIYTYYIIIDLQTKLSLLVRKRSQEQQWPCCIWQTCQG